MPTQKAPETNTTDRTEDKATPRKAATESTTAKKTTGRTSAAGAEDTAGKATGKVTEKAPRKTSAKKVAAKTGDADETAKEVAKAPKKASAKKASAKAEDADETAKEVAKAPRKAAAKKASAKAGDADGTTKEVAKAPKKASAKKATAKAGDAAEAAEKATDKAPKKAAAKKAAAKAGDAAEAAEKAPEKVTEKAPKKASRKAAAKKTTQDGFDDTAAGRAWQLAVSTPDAGPDLGALFACPFPRFDGIAFYPEGPVPNTVLLAAQDSALGEYQAAVELPPDRYPSPSGRETPWSRRLPSALDSLVAWSEQNPSPAEKRALELVEQDGLFAEYGEEFFYDMRETYAGESERDDMDGEDGDFPEFPAHAPAEDDGVPDFPDPAPGEEDDPEKAPEDEDKTLAELRKLADEGSLIACFACLLLLRVFEVEWIVPELRGIHPDLPPEKFPQDGKEACVQLFLERNFEPFMILSASVSSTELLGIAPWGGRSLRLETLKERARTAPTLGSTMLLTRLVLEGNADLDEGDFLRLLLQVTTLADFGIWPALEAWGNLAARFGTAAAPHPSLITLFRNLLADAMEAGVPDAFATAGNPDIAFLTGYDGATAAELLRRGIEKGSWRSHLQAARFQPGGWNTPSMVPAYELIRDLVRNAPDCDDLATFNAETNALRTRMLFSGPWEVKEEVAPCVDCGECEEWEDVTPERLRSKILRNAQALRARGMPWLLHAYARVLMRERLLDRPDARRDLEKDNVFHADTDAMFHLCLHSLEKYFRKRPPRNARDEKDREFALDGLDALVRHGNGRALVFKARAHRYGVLGFEPLPIPRCAEIILTPVELVTTMHARATATALYLDGTHRLGGDKYWDAAEKALQDLFDCMRVDHLALAQALILADRFDLAGGGQVFEGSHPTLTAAMKNVLARHSFHLRNFFCNSMPLHDDPTPLIALGRHLLDTAGNPRCEERIAAFLAEARDLYFPDLSRVTDCASLGETLLSTAAARGYVPTSPD